MDSNHILYYYNLYSSTIPIRVIIGCLFAFLVYYVLNTRNHNKKSRNPAPEVAGAWPIIGHLHHLVGEKLLHETLGAMADKYGPIFTIRMGLHKALVVSSWEVAKECFTTNDVVFNSRPQQVAIKHMGYGAAMFGIAPYGTYYLEMRKMVAKELLSNIRLELLKHVWGSEINTSIKELYEKVEHGGGGGPVLVEMKRWLGFLTLKTTVKVICGKQALGGTSNYTNTRNEGDDEVGRFHKALRDFFKLLGHFRVSDVIPLPEWLDFEGYEEMKKNGRELDSLMEKWLEEHKMKKKRSLISSGETENKYRNDEQDFMDVMMSKLDEDEAKLLSYYDADTINKSTCLTLILGGTDTTSVTLTWALSLLVNHPYVLKKAHDELDIHVGRERQVDELDIKNLKYLQAIIKETLRLYPPGVLTAPRESKADCTVAGYDIPAGTRLFVNIWKIHRDPRVWSDPSEFQPDRFFTSRHVDMDLRGKNFELIPFGSGRRSCPGTSFALQVLHLALARLLHGFDFKRPSDTPIDMTEVQGLTNAKTTPLEILVTPRLSSKLYAC